MNRLLTAILLLATFAGFGQNEQFIDSVFSHSKSYKDRFIRDGGVMLSDRLTKAYMLMAEKNGIADNIEFGWMSGAATKQRKDGIYNYATKLYEIYNGNDATQTTEASQPYVSGNIAPNEVESLKTPNGENRHMKHTEIAFLDGEEWSITNTITNTSNQNIRQYYSSYSGGSTGLIGLRHSNLDARTSFYVNATSGFIYYPPVNDYIGKTIHITYVNNSGSLTQYINGIQIGSNSVVNSEISINEIFRGSFGFEMSGTISAHIIRAQALTPSQVAAEHALLREIYPEIPSVKIGEYTVATSSLEIAASTDGTAITQATDNTDWQTGAARWCYHSDDTALGSVYGKIYNKAARDVIIANPPSGWHVATEAELTELATYNEALMIPGTDYWTANIGTNTTGFSAIGGASRNADGTFNTIKEGVSFWCADSDKVLSINNSGVATIATATANEGHYIRLVKD